jgi:serine/threonine protein kinase/tetratricopeptide (TPR) repeat protein
MLPGSVVLGELGRGGMGVVYKARQSSLKRLVALKMILAGPYARADQLARFQIEAEAVARLQHPNIVQIYEVAERNGVRFLCLEFIEGGNLLQKLARTPQPPAEAARLLAVLARAVHYAHQRGIIHRDLKPENVLLTADGTPKIADFGLAKQLDDDAFKSHGGPMGTPSYMAPEQTDAGRGTIGPATDVYALGAILYEMLTGRPPFRAATVQDTLDQVRHQDPVPPRRLQPTVPRDLETICLKCLRKEVYNRYASALALADDLGRFLAKEPITARPVSVWERGLKWARRRPAVAGLLLASGAALLSLLLALGLYLNEERRQSRQELEHRLGVERSLKEAKELVGSAQAAHRLGRLADSARDVSRALDKLENAQTEPALLDLLAEARDLERRNTEARKKEEEVQEAVRRQKSFYEYRKKALFHTTLAVGGGLVTNTKATEDAARRGLSEMGFLAKPGAAGPEGQAVPQLDATLKKDCYELLLILAAAVAEPVPGQTPEAHQARLRESLDLLRRAADLGEDTQAFHRRRAQYLTQLGDQPGARLEMDQADQRSPKGALDYYLLGDSYYKQDNLAEAVRAFENALRDNPNHFWSRYFLAMCHLRLKRPGEAKTGLTACLSQEKDFVWLYLMRGYAHGLLNEYEAAEADFQAAEQCRPEGESEYVLYANRGVMRLRQAQAPAAVASSLRLLAGLVPPPLLLAAPMAEFAETSKRVAQAVSDFREALKRKEDYLAHYSLAQGLEAQLKGNEALDEYQKAIRLAELSPGPRPAFLYRGRARLYAERKKWQAALIDLERALQDANDPFRARDFLDRGRILQQLKRLDDALRAYDDALASRQDDPRAYLGRAQVLRQLGQPEKAVSALDRYLALGGKPSAEVYRARGRLRESLRRDLDALDDYHRLVELEPNDPGAYIDRGRVLLVCRAYALARDDFARALILKPDAGEAFLGRGYAYAKLSQPALADADAAAALRLDQRSKVVLDMTARIYALAAAALDADPPPGVQWLRTWAAYLEQRSKVVLDMAARIYALAAAALDADPPPGVQGLRTRAAYQDQALDLLEQALRARSPAEGSAFWKESVVKHPDWNALRGSARFARLAADYGGGPMNK